MRMPVAARLGVAALIVGLAGSIGSVYWLKSRNWVPVDIPISLSRGHIRSGNFVVNVPGTYVASIVLDQGFSSSCLEYRDLHETWTVSGNTRTVERPYYGLLEYEFESDGGVLSLDLDITSDSSCLNDRNPRLRVEASADTYESHSFVSFFLWLFMLCAGIGTVLVFRSWSHKLAEQESGGTLTPFLPRRWSAPELLTRRLAGRDTGHASATFRRRMFPRREITPSLPTIGYFYALTSFVLFLTCSLPVLLGPRIPVGLPVTLVRMDAWKIKTDSTFEPLVIRVELGHQLYLNAKPMSADELSKALGEQLARRPNWYVYVDADPNVQFADVAWAIDIIRGQHADAVMVTPRTLKAHGAK
jgi:biopolymer transport protein ExbD